MKQKAPFATDSYRYCVPSSP